MLSPLLFVVCVTCIVVAQIFILRSALGTAVVRQEGVVLPRPRRAAELAWAVLPAVALMLVLWMTWRESRAAVPPPAEMHEHGGHGAHSS